MRRVLSLTILIPLLFSAAQARSEDHSNGAKNDTAATGPKLVLIIRHAEKPADTADSKHLNLSAKGFERAWALAWVIPRDFARPDFLIATKKSAHSNRPVETIEPLASSLHLVIESSLALPGDSQG